MAIVTEFIIEFLVRELLWTVQIFMKTFHYTENNSPVEMSAVRIPHKNLLASKIAMKQYSYNMYG